MNEWAIGYMIAGALCGGHYLAHNREPEHWGDSPTLAAMFMALIWPIYAASLLWLPQP